MFFERKVDAIKEEFEIEYLKSPMFLFSRSDFSSYIKEKKPFMGNFYKFSRIKNNILVKENKPIGGKWSYDEENRKKIPKGINIPKISKVKAIKLSGITGRTGAIIGITKKLNAKARSEISRILLTK